MSRGTGDYSQTPDKLMGDDVLCVAVHGDAAFAGQVIAQIYCGILKQNLHPTFVFIQLVARAGRKGRPLRAQI